MSTAAASFDAERIAVAGAGRLAQALGRLLRERGEPVTAVASRQPAHAQAAALFIGGVEPVPYAELPARAGRVLIVVSDEAITPVAALLAAAGMKQGCALHTCGACGPEALQPLAAAGVSCATLHPLMTVSSPARGLSALPGSAFAISGDQPAAAWAERIAALLDGLPLRIPSPLRPLYHAAAVMASNYLIALLDAAVTIMAEIGIERRQALRAIRPLAQATIDNVLDLGPLEALTGPVHRGDAATISSHLAALSRLSPSLPALYRAAGLHTLELARRRGLPEDKAARILELLRECEVPDV